MHDETIVKTTSRQCQDNVKTMSRQRQDNVKRCQWLVTNFHENISPFPSPWFFRRPSPFHFICFSYFPYLLYKLIIPLKLKFCRHRDLGLLLKEPRPTQQPPHGQPTQPSHGQPAPPTQSLRGHFYPQPCSPLVYELFSGPRKSQS